MSDVSPSFFPPVRPPPHPDQQDFLAAISTDELGWLNAYNSILQEPPSLPNPSSPIPIPKAPSPSMSTVPINDSLTLLRAKGMGRRRYQTSTKASHAKSVQPKATADIGLPASLRTSVTPTAAKRTRTNSLRNGARANRASPTKLAQQEWIYRHPKSPGTPGSAPTTVGTSPRHSNVPSPGRPARRPATRYGPPEELSSPFWSNVLRPHSQHTKGVPLSQLKVDQSASHSSCKLPSPVSNCSSPISTSSSSSSTLSSHPDTPTSPSLPSLLRYNGKKYQRRYGELDSDSSASTLVGRIPSSSRSILAEPLASKELPEKTALSAARKNSVGTTASSTGSSKSVKFVELPTVHYASVGYWDAEHLEDDDEVMMGIDVGGMDMEARGSPIPSRMRQDADGSGDIDIFAIDGPPWMHPDADNFGSPRKETLVRAPEKPGPMKRLASLRKGSTARNGRSSIPVPVKSRPPISGPLVLGSRPTASAPASLARSSTSVISIRHAPSVESFRSARSGGGKSIRSLSSLKSTFTANARGLREWIRERVVGLDIGVVG